VKLTTLRPKVATLGSRVQSVPTASDRRITGRTLQNRRLRIWSRNPHCATCGRLVAYPHGFELDHTVPLCQGGADTDENCQVLCNGADGCHEAKTRTDLSQRPRRGEGGIKSPPRAAA
jgi:5-methylcytosine-specific restriction protein A